MDDIPRAVVANEIGRLALVPHAGEIDPESGWEADEDIPSVRYKEQT